MTVNWVVRGEAPAQPNLRVNSPLPWQGRGDKGGIGKQIRMKKISEHGLLADLFYIKLAQILAQLAANCWVSQPAERLCLDLPHALAGYTHLAPYLFQRVGLSI